MSNAARRDAPPGRRYCFSEDRPLAWLGYALEEIDAACLERVLGTDDQQAAGLDQTLDDLRSMTQMADRYADVGANRVPHEGGGIVPQFRRQQRLH
jgi:hypothetical protein